MLGRKHSPQKVSTFTVTLSPGFTKVTSAPTCSTTPYHLMPDSYSGTARGNTAMFNMKTGQQMLLSVTRTIASRESFISGLAFSCNSNFPCSIYVCTYILPRSLIYTFAKIMISLAKQISFYHVQYSQTESHSIFITMQS